MCIRSREVVGVHGTKETLILSASSRKPGVGYGGSVWVESRGCLASPRNAALLNPDTRATGLISNHRFNASQLRVRAH